MIFPLFEYVRVLKDCRALFRKLVGIDKLFVFESVTGARSRNIASRRRPLFFRL